MCIRTRHLTPLVVLSLLLLVPIALGQTPSPLWQQTNGPEGGYVFGLGVNPNPAKGYMFAAVMGAGVYRSTDGGSSWERVFVSMGNANDTFWSGGIAVTQMGTVLASTGHLFRSADDGHTWTPVVDPEAQGESIAVNPTNGHIFLGRGGDVVVAVSTDDGETWSDGGDLRPVSSSKPR